MQKPPNFRVVARSFENGERRSFPANRRQSVWLDFEMRQDVAPIFVARVAPQKRLDGELQTWTKILPIIFAAAQVKIYRFNRDVVETKIRPIKPTAQRKIAVADQFDKLILALCVAIVVTSPSETRNGFLPLFRKNFLIKRVESLAFEFRGRYTRLRQNSCYSPFSSANRLESRRVAHGNRRPFSRR